jgi:Ca2+-transporting ATPase
LAIEGPKFRNMSDEEKEAIVPKLRVLARSSPLDKEILVRWLKAHGDVVAVTGDGTNDAPALKAADVGLAMGIQGTDYAKQAASIVILDDNFATIVRSVMWGRSVYDNIKKFVQFQLTVNVVALTLTLIGAFSGDKVPLTAVQLLWVNLIMDTFAALAFDTEMPTEALLDRKPYAPKASIISPVMIRSIVGQAILQITVLCIILFRGDQIFGVEIRGKDGVHLTIVFNTFVFLQIWNELNARKVNGELNIFEKFFDNWIFTYVLIVSLIMQLLMVEVFGSFASTVRVSVCSPICAHCTFRSVFFLAVNRSDCMKFSVHFKISTCRLSLSPVLSFHMCRRI